MNAHWQQQKLGDIFDIARGGSPRPIEKFLTDNPNGLNWIKISDATGGGKYIRSTKEKISPLGLSRTRVVNAGDFLLTNSMSFGRPYIMATSGCIHDGWLVLKPKAKNIINEDFIYHFINSDAVYAKFVSRAGGSTVKNLNLDIVSSIEISLPPLDEQRRIAAVLDQADALRRKRKRSLELTESLTQSIFLDVHASSETTMSIAEMIAAKWLTLHKDGNHGSNYPRSNEFAEVGVPFLSVQCIDDTENINETAVAFLNKDKANTLKIGWIEAGDVLLAHNASVGKVAIYNGNLGKALIGTSLTCFRPNVLKISSEYLAGALRSSIFQQQLSKSMKQTTRNQVPITAQRELLLPIISSEKQNAFTTAVVEQRLERSKMLKHSKLIDVLFLSLQHRAFSGQL